MWTDVTPAPTHFQREHEQRAASLQENTVKSNGIYLQWFYGLLFFYNFDINFCLIAVFRKLFVSFFGIYEANSCEQLKSNTWSITLARPHFTLLLITPDTSPILFWNVLNNALHSIHYTERINHLGEDSPSPGCEGGGGKWSCNVQQTRTRWPEWLLVFWFPPGTTLWPVPVF